MGPRKAWRSLGGRCQGVILNETSLKFRISAHSRERSCPLCPRKQTCAVQQLMSALGQKRTLMLLDHLVGAADEPRRHRQADCSRGLQIDRHLEFGRELNGKIAWFGALQDTVNITGRATMEIGEINAVRNQPSDANPKGIWIRGRQAKTVSERNDQFALSRRVSCRYDNQASLRPLSECSNGSLQTLHVVPWRQLRRYAI